MDTNERTQRIDAEENEHTQRIDAEENERTQRIAEAQHDQDSTRRLTMYEEERERTRRLDASPPWDTPDHEAQHDWDPEARPAALDQASRRRWSTTTVLLSALLGVLLGMFGVLTTTSGTQEQITVLDTALRDTQGAVQERDRRIEELERQLEDARPTPLGGVLPEDFTLPQLELPGLDFLNQEQRRDFMDDVRDQIEDAREDSRRGRD